MRDRFHHYFRHEITGMRFMFYRSTASRVLTILDLQDQMSRLADKSLIGGERTDATEHCQAGINRLQSELREASSYLAPYDLKTYGQAVEALREKLAETKASFGPNKRFQFTSRKNPSAISLSDAAELAAQKRRGIPGYMSPNGNNSHDTSMSTTPNYLRSPPNEKETQTSAQQNRDNNDTDPQTSEEKRQQLPGPPQQNESIADQRRSFPEMSSLPERGSSNPQDSHMAPIPDPTKYPSHAIRRQTFSLASSVSLSSLTNQHIVVPTSSSHASIPCSLTNISQCVLDLAVPTENGAPFAGLTVRDVRDSLLVCGKVDGSAHLTNLRNCTVVVNCRQFRMHDCKAVDVYLRCNSRPIIENCKNIRFTRLPACYVSHGSPSLHDLICRLT